MGLEVPIRNATFPILSVRPRLRGGKSKVGPATVPDHRRDAQIRMAPQRGRGRRTAIRGVSGETDPRDGRLVMHDLTDHRSRRLRVAAVLPLAAAGWLILGSASALAATTTHQASTSASTGANGKSGQVHTNNGNGGGKATGKPCAGCVGKADNKNPKGQMPNGSDANAGYECDRNHGIGRTNPAHTGCTSTPPPCDEATEDCGNPPPCDEATEDCGNPPPCDEATEDCGNPPPCAE